jgi:hypothetical protein
MKKWSRKTHELPTHKEIVRIQRSAKITDVLDGYIVGKSKRLALLHLIDPNFINLNGYCAVRIRDIRRWRVRHDHEFFLNRAFQLKGIAPVQLDGIDLSNLHNLIKSSRKQFPLTTIHRELLDNTVCNIGRVRELTKKALILDEISPAARWERTGYYRYKDITRLEFGGSYEEALLLVAESAGREAMQRDRSEPDQQ